MSKRGRKPKPRSVHELEGTDRVQHRGADLDAGQDVNSPPDHLNENAVQFWRDAMRTWATLGVQPANRYELEGMATLYAIMRDPESDVIQYRLAFESLRKAMNGASLTMESWIRGGGETPDRAVDFFDGPKAVG